jgi:hypothetical protein
MLSRRAKEVTQRLIRTNLFCNQVMMNGCERVKDTVVSDALRKAAFNYAKNAEDLRRLLEHHGVPSADGTELEGQEHPPAVQFPDADGSATPDAPRFLVEALRLAKAVRKEYQASIEEMRELSELLPRQFARVNVVFNSLRSLLEEERTRR